MAVGRGFATAEEHDEHIIENWNKVVNKKDTVWILGDITMEKAKYEILDRLKGLKNVVLGNHDMPQHVPKMLEHVNKVCSTFTKKGIIFTHIPIHPREFAFRYKTNIHGHLHSHIVTKTVASEFELRGTEEVPDDRYINVSCEQVNFTPILLNTLIN
tara:strand:+ start:1946 stop:2416 length:471 start_codon:yes stop_codon:yes gene_type:complete